MIPAKSKEIRPNRLFGSRSSEHKDQKAIISDDQTKQKKLHKSNLSDQAEDFYIVKRMDLVKVITSETKTNSTGESSSTVVDEQEDEDEKILIEDAACKICFVQFSVDETSIMQTNCMCKKAYIHKECSSNWAKDKGNRKCDICGSEVTDIPIELIQPRGSDASQSRGRRFFGR